MPIASPPVEDRAAPALTTARLFEAMGPCWQLDELCFEQLRVFDCFRYDTSEQLTLELRDAAQTPASSVRIHVAPAASQPAFVCAAGLGISGAGTRDPELEAQVCQAVARSLTEHAHEPAGGWTLPAPADDELPPALRDEVTSREASLGPDPDRLLLEADADRYRDLYGVRPSARRVVVRGDAVPGVSMHYPAAVNGTVPASGAIRAMPANVAKRRAFRGYFGRLGCVFDRQSMARTVPTPSTLRDALHELGRGPPPLLPRLVPGRFMSIRPRAWARLVSAGTLPVPVASRAWVEVYRATRASSLLASVPIDTGMLVHDMGLHALAFHAIPRAAWDRLASTSRRLLRRRSAGAAVSRFFEGTLTQACWEIWESIDDPAEFPAAFEARSVALERALEAGRERA